MKKFILTFLFAGLFSEHLFTLQAAGQPSPGNLTLWYDQAASAWEEALPLGNGRIGAMVFGSPLEERYQLNEETLWSGGPKKTTNPNALKALPEIRKAIDEGDYKKAGDLWKKHAQGPYTECYLPLGDLKIKMPALQEAGNVYRDLDISRAVATVRFESGGTIYTRTSFISWPDQVMVIKLEADKKSALDFVVSLSSPLKSTSKCAKTASAGTILELKGKAPKYVSTRSNEIEYAEEDSGEGTNFMIHVKVIHENGTLTENNDTLRITGADSAMIILSTATSHNGFNKSPGLEGRDPAPVSLGYLKDAMRKPYADLLAAHIEDYRGLFDRVSLTLGGDSSANNLPTDKRLTEFGKDDSDTGLVALYYQFGRYLSIASSRPGSIPANLQGIWNRHIKPPWRSNYTTNINTEMNYWPAEPTNLPECHQPLLQFIESLAATGKETARINYGINKGWIAHHNSDIWAQTGPTGGYDRDPSSSPSWSCWPAASSWFCQHLWEHYLYNGNEEFLRRKAYPLMKGAAEFMLEWLVDDKTTGYLVTSPSTSPENFFRYKDKNGKTQNGALSKASTMDMAMIRDLFSNCINASRVLNTDKAFRNKLEKAQEKLFPFHLGSKGQLQEWFEDFEEQDSRHRHVSHLFGLHPGRQISPRTTPALAAAAKKTLELRGDGGTGWSMAWKINFWARLEDGNHAYKMLKNGLRHVVTKGVVMSGGGTYSNLFDAHPPFQIDGNFGGTAGITEMLLQSHTEDIFLLPALPDVWKEGEIRGIRARGGFTFDLVWKEGKLAQVKVHSKLGGNCRIRSHAKLSSPSVKWKEAEGDNPNRFYFPINPTPYKTRDNAAQAPALSLRETHVVDFDTAPGKSYVLEAP